MYFLQKRTVFFQSFLTFIILSALFILSLFYRVSNAVIAPNLMQDLGLNAESLGILGGAYFYSFTLLQIPMGPMLDRIGPRMVITFFPLIGALGAFLFAFGESLTIALVGRILIGVGMSCCLMGAMKVFTLKFPPQKFATLLGIFISVGTFGQLLAASPLAYLTSIIGWRTIFIIAGVMTTILAFLVFWVLGEGKTKGVNPFSSSLSQPEIRVFQSIRLIFGSLSFWQIGTVAFFRYGTFISLQGLWLGVYLMDIKKFSPVQTGNLLILMVIGKIIGDAISGRLSDRVFHSRKGLGLWGMSLYALSLFPLIGVLKIQSPLWIGLDFFFIGFFCSFGNLVYSHVKELFPITISGTVMTSVNFLLMAGGAAFMPVMGKVIGSFPTVDHAYPPEAYHLSFLICFLGMVASLIFYSFSKKEPPLSSKLT